MTAECIFSVMVYIFNFKQICACNMLFIASTDDMKGYAKEFVLIVNDRNDNDS